MFGKYKTTINNLLNYAKQNNDIIAMILIGSYSRKEKPADNYSDLDLIMCTTDPDKYTNNMNWLNNFGKIICVFIEPFFDGQKEIRVLYEDSRDIDIPIQSFNSEQFINFFKNSDVLTILNNGFNVIYDKTKTIEKKIRISLNKLEIKDKNYSQIEIEN